MAWQKDKQNVSCVNIQCKIGNLSPGMTGIKTVGIVIAKGSPRDKTISNSGSGDGVPKSVFSFTIRDSITDYVNVTCWAVQENGKNIAAAFHIGDVVQISHASVQQKIEGSFADRCLVQTPVPNMLSINDRYRSVELYCASDLSQYLALKSELVVPAHEHMNLTEIMQYANAKLKNSSNQEYLTFFAGVKHVGDIRESIAKHTSANESEGRTIKRMQVTLFDESCACLPLVIWDDENIRLASTWIPKKTILSVVNCRIKYDSYRNGFIGTLESQSLIIPNPKTREIQRLKIFMETFALSHQPQDDISLASSSFSACITEPVQLTSIHQVAVVRDLLDMKFENEYGLLYGILSRFDIDSDNCLMYTVRRCRQCKRKISMNPLMCINEDCSMNVIQLGHIENAQLDFGTTVHISDHSGTLTACYFGGSAMQEFLKITPHELVMMPHEGRVRIKYQSFMHRFKFYFKTSMASFNKDSTITKILAIQEPDFHEAMEALRGLNQKRQKEILMNN